MYTDAKNKRLNTVRAEYEEEYRMMCEEPLDDTFDTGEEQIYWQEMFSDECYAHIAHTAEIDW